jgi:hypothetical protein
LRGMRTIGFDASNASEVDEINRIF